MHIRSGSGGLIAQSFHEHRQLRRHSSGQLVQTRAEPFTNFLAKRHAVDAADPTLTFVRGHEASNLLVG
jgi:hypothetical protein